MEKEMSNALSKLESKLCEHKVISDSLLKEILSRLNKQKLERIKEKIKPVLDYMKENFNLTEEEENAFTFRVYNYFFQKKVDAIYVDVELANIQMLSEIFDNVGIPISFKRSLLIGYLIEDYASTEHIKDALSIVHQAKKQRVSLIISGAPGIGKTLLACHLLWTYLILNDYKNTKSVRFYSYYNLEKNFLDKKFIVVDDFNLMPKDKIRDLIYKIYDNDILAVLTTNLSDLEFLNMFKNELRVLRRIGEKFRWLFLSH
jgi:DNA replication protein DnaC